MAREDIAEARAQAPIAQMRPSGSYHARVTIAGLVVPAASLRPRSMATNDGRGAPRSPRVISFGEAMKF